MNFWLNSLFQLIIIIFPDKSAVIFSKYNWAVSFWSKGWIAFVVNEITGSENIWGSKSRRS